MKLFDCFSEAGFHTSIATTFSVDFDAYESVVLPRLREAGCNNNILIADDRMLGYALGLTFRLPKYAGRRYSVVGAHAQGVYHPKLILQLGKSKGRLIVASANMTTSGLAGNLEVVGEVLTDEGDSEAVPILRAALEYLADFVKHSPVSRRQMDWAMKRTRWMRDSQASATQVTLESGGLLAFLAQNNAIGIGERFANLVGRRPVRRLIIISPYWDHNLAAARELCARLKPTTTSLLIQPNTALFPGHAMRRRDSLRLYDIGGIDGDHAGRFAHAKLVIAETKDTDCVLFGSANCTTAALGTGGDSGSNHEACLYRELPGGSTLIELGLTSALDDSMVIEASDLPAFEPAEDIPMKELEARLPGRFELSGELLYWSPPRGIEVAASELTLFDENGVKFECSFNRIGQSIPATFRLDSQQLPHFVRVITAGVESSLGIVVVEQAIQDMQRRAVTKNVGDALAFLADDEAFEGLWMLDVIQKLEAAERDVKLGQGSGDIARPGKRGDRVAEVPVVLTYNRFIAGRRAAGAPSPTGSSSLGASHAESVRSFLNFLIGTHSRNVLVDEPDGPSAAPQFPLGDETASGEDALESGEELNKSVIKSPVQLERERQKQLRRRQEYVKDTQQTIEHAAERFVWGLREQAEERPLGMIDVLRLRALLMVVLSAGSKKSDLLPKDVEMTFSRRQVLPSSGETSWRKLIGRLLWAFFRSHGGSNGPLINSVTFEAEPDGDLPTDVLECWATCFWAACASHVALDENNKCIAPTTSEINVAADLYLNTGLVPDELCGDTVKAVFKGLGDRYGERLGVSPAALLQEHERLSKALTTVPRTGGIPVAA